MFAPTTRSLLQTLSEARLLARGRTFSVVVPPVVDRLFVLNAKRAEQEKLLGLGTAKSKKTSAKAKTETPSTGKKPCARKKKTQGQLGLLGNDDEGTG